MAWFVSGSAKPLTDRSLREQGRGSVAPSSNRSRTSHASSSSPLRAARISDSVSQIDGWGRRRPIHPTVQRVDVTARETQSERPSSGPSGREASVVAEKERDTTHLLQWDAQTRRAAAARRRQHRPTSAPTRVEIPRLNLRSARAGAAEGAGQAGLGDAGVCFAPEAPPTPPQHLAEIWEPSPPVTAQDTRNSSTSSSSSRQPTAQPHVYTVVVVEGDTAKGHGVMASSPRPVPPSPNTCLPGRMTSDSQHVLVPSSFDNIVGPFRCASETQLPLAPSPQRPARPRTAYGELNRLYADNLSGILGSVQSIGLDESFATPLGSSHPHKPVRRVSSAGSQRGRGSAGGPRPTKFHCAIVDSTERDAARELVGHLAADQGTVNIYQNHHLARRTTLLPLLQRVRKYASVTDDSLERVAEEDVVEGAYLSFPTVGQHSLPTHLKRRAVLTVCITRVDRGRPLSKPATPPHVHHSRPTPHSALHETQARLQAFLRQQGLRTGLNFLRFFEGADRAKRGYVAQAKTLDYLTQELRAPLPAKELEALVAHFDAPGAGALAIYPFLNGIFPPLPEARQAAVQWALARLAAASATHVSVDLIRRYIDPRGHPLALSGEADAAEVARYYLAPILEGTEVLIEDFEMYHRALSLYTARDDDWGSGMDRLWRRLPDTPPTALPCV